MDIDHEEETDTALCLERLVADLVSSSFLMVRLSMIR